MRPFRLLVLWLIGCGRGLLGREIELSPAMRPAGRLLKASEFDLLMGREIVLKRGQVRVATARSGFAIGFFFRYFRSTFGSRTNL